MILGRDKVTKVTLTASPRPTLLSISVRRSAAVVNASVSLCLDGRTLSGEVTRNDDDRSRAIASATLAALDSVLAGPVSLESAQVVAIPGRKVAITVLELPDEQAQFRTLVGSALVRGEIEDALALSVLDALDHQSNDEE